MAVSHTPAALLSFSPALSARQPPALMATTARVSMPLFASRCAVARLLPEIAAFITDAHADTSLFARCAFWPLYAEIRAVTSQSVAAALPRRRRHADFTLPCCIADAMGQAARFRRQPLRGCHGPATRWLLAAYRASHACRHASHFRQLRFRRDYWLAGLPVSHDTPPSPARLPPAIDNDFSWPPSFISFANSRFHFADKFQAADIIFADMPPLYRHYASAA